MTQLAAFTQSLSAQSIVRAADREAGSPGLYLTDAGSEGLTAPAYVKLQAILDHEALTSDWPFTMDSVTIQITGRTTALPSDYWNAAFVECWWIHPTTGDRDTVRLMDRREFHDGIRPSNLMDGPPERACVVKNQGHAAGGSTPTGVIMVDPVWSTHYLLELHYSPLSVPLAAITTKPWLPHSLYLIKRLVAELYSDQDDQRAVLATQMADRLKRDMKMASDPGQRPRSIRVSPDCFTNPVRI